MTRLIGARDFVSRAAKNAGNEQDLRLLFRALAKGSLAVSVGACASSFPAIDDATFDEPICEAEQWKAATGLEPNESFDSISAHEIYAENPFDTTGTVCATATDPTACQQAVVDASILTGLVTTRGDEVRFWGPQEFVAFVGPVNTPQEALLLAWGAGYWVGCNNLERGAVRQVADGYEVVVTRMTQDCDPVVVKRYLLLVRTDGSIEELASEEISRESGVCVGRRPPGLCPSKSNRKGTNSGRYLANMAHLERSSVHAFQVLANELEALGAPARLITKAHRSAREETRHADTIEILARRFGARPSPVRTVTLPLRTLLQLAKDNAAEGCVRETFGAAVGTFQSMAAKNSDFAKAMTTIAKDETRHAAFSIELATWAKTQLSVGERDVVTQSKKLAIAQLFIDTHTEPNDELVAELGIPTAAQSREILVGLQRSLWA